MAGDNMAIRILYLIRHGQYQVITPMDGARTEGRDTGLTPLGKEQSQMLAERLSPLPVTAIHYSPLPRASQTAAIVSRMFPGVWLHRAEALQEVHPCYPPPPRDKRFRKKYSEETIMAGKAQADRVFARYFRTARVSDKHELLICHGNLIRYLITRVLGAPPEPLTYSMELCNCGVSEVLIRSNGQMQLISYNDVGFLPYELVTCLGARAFSAEQVNKSIKLET
jgi:serine/threonine-protein phosphatase PGAM5